ncbi:MAG: hypothetical protein NT062_03670 [Proteobacteria bacterium]|nr:hypothetical protein [Pseudomonadota bacterium]
MTTPTRPYLDPQPGENLPEKKVSSKAMGRLGKAADAIAATKKAIPAQGNQVPALLSTNMNSQYRLKVMRDERCWEFTTNESRQLAQQNWEAFTAAKADLAHGGNCGENAWVAYHYLRLHAKGEPIQMSAKSGLDHAFVIMGDLKNEKDNELAVSDPWPNNPTACLWEDHFAFTPDRNKIEDNSHMVADGKSFKTAIAAGLKLSSYGEQMVKMADSDAETKKKTDNWEQNHFWLQDDAASTKYEYKEEKPATQQQGPAPAGAQQDQR